MKPPARRVPSDDCVLTVEGVDYALHEGEWVEVRPGLTPHVLNAMRAIQELAPKLAALEGDEQAQRTVALMDDSLGDMRLVLADLVTGWSWTDDSGSPLPQPSAEGLAGLRIEELLYLMQVVQGNEPATEKNGSRPSGTTSLATRTAKPRT